MSEQHEHEEGQEVGVALAFRIFEAEGVMTLAEAEITPLEDEPTALGASSSSTRWRRSTSPARPSRTSPRLAPWSSATC